MRDETWVYHNQPETKQTSRIADSDQVQGCVLSEQSDGYRCRVAVNHTCRTVRTWPPVIIIFLGR